MAADANDGELIRRLAEDFLRLLGDGTPKELRERAAGAKRKGDALSERAWLDIAKAAEAMLREDGD
jgi:hypothetical protein